MVSTSVVAPKANLELESHPNTLQASSPYAWQQQKLFYESYAFPLEVSTWG